LPSPIPGASNIPGRACRKRLLKPRQDEDTPEAPLFDSGDNQGSSFGDNPPGAAENPGSGSEDGFPGPTSNNPGSTFDSTLPESADNPGLGFDDPSKSIDNPGGISNGLPPGSTNLPFCDELPGSSRLPGSSGSPGSSGLPSLGMPSLGMPSLGMPSLGMPGSSGLRGPGLPGSGLPGSRPPGSGLPGSRPPGSGLPGSGIPGINGIPKPGQIGGAKPPGTGPPQAAQNWKQDPPAWSDPKQWTSPSSARDTPGVTTSQQKFNLMRYYTEYAAASYCKNNIKDLIRGENRNVNCGANMCSRIGGRHKIVEASTEDVIGWTENKQVQKYSASHFIAIDDTAQVQAIVVSFEGTDTSNWQQLKKIFDAVTPVTWDVQSCSGCTVAPTFLQSWQNVRNSIYGAINANIGSRKRIIFTGHSAGAAIATIAVGEARTKPEYRDIAIDLVSIVSSQFLLTN
jgi:hypothetical protein